MTDDTVREKFQTDSQRYGNEKTISDAFERETSPIPGELEKALAETAHLTEDEAFAFVHGYIEGYPPVSVAEVADEIVQSEGFNNISEFKSIQQTAKEKIADAIWILELIDAYRFPDFPEECTECSRPLGGRWVEPEGRPGPLCRNCADIDGDPLEQL
jgi:hypothetical protein